MAVEFTVSVTKNVRCKTSYIYIPKPVLEKLGDTQCMTFMFDGGAMAVDVGTK